MAFPMEKCIVNIFYETDPFNRIHKKYECTNVDNFIFIQHTSVILQLFSAYNEQRVSGYTLLLSQLIIGTAMLRFGKNLPERGFLQC